MNSNNVQLNKLYNGNQTIVNSPYTMQSNLLVPMLARMVNEKLIPQKSMDVIQAILSFKHTESNPFPTYKTIARLLGKSEIYVRQAVAAIKKIGILGVKKGKEKLNNEYDFTPFFELLEKFIIKYNESKDGVIKVADLLKMKVVKKSEKKDFSWSEKYKDEEKEVVPTEPAETVEDASEEAEEVPEVTLPDDINKVLTAYSVQPEGVQAVKNAYVAFSGKLVNEIFIEKIMASLDKKDFVNYFTKCITTAYTSNEQPKQQQPVQQPNTFKPAYSRNKAKSEVTPEWFEEDKAKEEAERQALIEAEARKSFEEKVYGFDSKEKLNDFIAGMTLTDEQKAIVEAKRLDLDEEFARMKAKLDIKLENLYSDKREGVQ